ncbi:MAG: aminodeoxychorismate synthase component I [Pirellulaceae bacterium]
MRRLPMEWTPEYCFRRMSSLPGCVWLDSSLATSAANATETDESLGRYSYLAADPFSTLRIDKPQAGITDHLQRLCSRFFQSRLPDLPPLQGGWIGWFGYEFGGCFERVPLPAFNEFHLPLMVLGLYDTVLSWDHLLGQGWLISHGWPEFDPARRQQRAYRRLQSLMRRLESPAATKPSAWQQTMRSQSISQQQLAPQFETRRSPGWTSNYSPSGYRAAVARLVEYIHAGDVFQTNLAQRLLRPATCSPEELMLHLRQHSPAPFAGYADFGRIQVISSSPERFLRVEAGEIEARPIKGTRPRLTDPIADAGIAQLLLASDKDRSENVMIVDLLRNDLSRVADPSSVQVASLCGLEKYPFVWHLVSVIRARLAPGKSATDVLACTFPGGSITGAPKIRAMEIIAELEPTARGPYCGSLGYISFAGDMDLSILIRTVTASDGWWQVPVGGGIVADSQPNLEEQETWHKAEGILRAIDSL